MNRKIGVIFSYLLMFVEIFSAMLFTPLLIRSLGPSEYGVYQLVSSVTAYLMLLDLGVGTAIVRYIAKYRANGDKKKQSEFLGIATTFYIIIAILVLIIGFILVIIFPYVFAKGLSFEEIRIGKILLILNLISVSCSLGNTVFPAVIIAYERFFYSKVKAIVTVILRIGVCSAFLLLGAKSISIVAIHLIFNIVTRIIDVWYVRKKLNLRPTFSKPNVSFVKEIFAYSGFVTLQMIATQINSMTDSVLLGIFAEGSAVLIAIYSVGIQIVQYFKTIGGHVNGVLMAGAVRLVESGAKPKDLQNEMVRIGRINFMMLGIVFATFLVNGKHFLTLWVGEGYEQSYYVAIAVMIPTMFNIVQSIGNQILWALNKHRVLAIIQVVSAFLNVILTIFLIRWNPLVGAVIGSVIALVVGDIFCMNIVFKKDVKISLMGYYLGLAKGIVPALVISFISGLIFNIFGFERYGWVGFIINCAFVVCIYGICMIVFGMNESEKKMLLGMWKKIARR